MEKRTNCDIETAIERKSSDFGIIFSLRFLDYCKFAKPIYKNDKISQDYSLENI
jgi:hypothetical protein